MRHRCPNVCPLAAGPSAPAALTLLAALMLSAGPAHGAKSAARASRPAPRLVWPPPPAPPRVAYVESISSPADLGIRGSGLSRFFNALIGAGRERDRLAKPFAVATDEQDNLLLTDTGANAVCLLDRARKRWLRWDRADELPFASPVAVARSGDTIFVADSALAAVLAFNLKGKLLFQITNRLERPSGLALLGERLFVVDAARHCVVVFDRAGRFLTEWGRRGVGPGEFNFPTHLTASPAGELFITDSMNHRVQRLDADGRFKNQIGQAGDAPGHFHRPKGVAVDTFGHVYVMDAMFDNVQVFDPTGRFLLSLGQAGSGPGEFWLPNGIAIGRQNRIYVADSYNRRVQVFEYIGPE